MTDGQFPAWLEWDPDTQEWVTYLPVLNRPAPGAARPAAQDGAPADAPPADQTRAPRSVRKAPTPDRESKKK
jgi:hypothetical protein